MKLNKCFIKKLRNIIAFALLISIMTVALMLCIISGGQNYSAQALTVSNAYLAGNGEELWDADTASLNKTVLDDISKKLFNGVNPKSYIMSNGTSDYETYGQYSQSPDAGTPYYVVPASTINKSVNNPDNGMVVKLNGVYWMATSLTIDKNDNVVLTLMTVATQATMPFKNVKDNPTNKDKSVTAYSCSDIRQELLTWQFYKGDFAKYLVQPKNIQYQLTETCFKRIGWNHFANDALGELTSGWNSAIHFSPEEQIGSYKYNSWGEDYIWLPSLTETGSTRYLKGTGIWNLSKNQCATDISAGDYLRSSDYGNYRGAFYLRNDGSCESNIVGNGRGVRPAIHLNLTAAGLGETQLENPADITTTYSGEAQTLKGLSSDLSWYDAEWYEHTGDYIGITNYDKEGNEVASIKDAGEYWVKAEITNTWINAVNAQADADKVKFGWTDAETVAAKTRRKPQFKGDGDTSDAAHMESDTVRWFKFTVNKKEVTVNKPVYNASTGTLDAPTFADMTELYADVPVLGVRITGTASDGTKYDAIDTLPTKRGSYVARAVFIKSATDKTETETNYAIKDANNCKCDIVIGFNRLPIVGVANATSAYTGSEITFPLSGYSSAWANVAGLTLPAGVTLKGSDSAGWALAAEEAGEYTITATLKSDKVSDWCWDVADKKIGRAHV